jgi:hypothetical protein
MAAKKAFWETKNPKKKSSPLSAGQKKSAQARAKKAGRPYPNLVDNAWASRQKWVIMPKVGKKEFSYTKAGMKAAKKEADKTGKPMKNVKKGAK